MSVNRGGSPAPVGEWDDAYPRLDVDDPNPPEWAHFPAEEVVRQAVDPGSGGMLRWRRRTAAAPVLSFTDRFLTGTLNLRAVEFPFLLEFVRCRFEQTPDLRQTNVAGLAFEGCWLPGLHAGNMSSGNDIALVDTTVQGEVELTDARIRGSLLLTGSQLVNQGGRALTGDRLDVAGALLATNLEAVGQVRIPGLRATGNVNFSGAGLHNLGSCALDGNGLRIGGNLVCATDKVTKRAFTAEGGIFLPSAHIASDLSLRGARLQPSPGEPNWPLDNEYYEPHTALIADRIQIDGNADLDHDFRSTGTLRMVNGRIGGSLRLKEAEIDISGGGSAPYANHALHLDGTEIQSDLDARSMRITGEARIVDVEVAGSIRLDGAFLLNPGEDVWNARRCSVGSTIECREADIFGSVNMQGALIGANLDLRGSRLSKPGRYTRDQNIKPCLDLRDARIGRDLICAAGTIPGSRAFAAAGEIRMHRVFVGRQMNFTGAHLGLDGQSTALSASGAQTQELRLMVSQAPQGRVNLRQAHCGLLADRVEFWSATGRIELDGFRYDALFPAIGLQEDDRVRERLGWLRNAMRGDYRPGPYDQFAAMLRASGNDEHADTALMEKQRRRYAALAKGFEVPGAAVPRQVLGFLQSTCVVTWSLLQRWMVGYGYRQVRALFWLVLLLVAGTLWFYLVPQHCQPLSGSGNADPSNYKQYRVCPASNQDDHLVWNPFLYTLDLLIPIVDFGNKGRWAPLGASQWFGAGLQAAGWILATTVAAGITRILRRQ